LVMTARATKLKHPADVGIEVRHKKGCSFRTGPCDCGPSFRGTVYDRAARKNRHGPWITKKAMAKGWRIDALARIQRGEFGPATKITLSEIGETWFAGATAGSIRNKSLHPYKPRVVRDYKSCFKTHVEPTFGAVQLGKLKRRDLQDLVDRLALTLSENTVHNAITPVRAICSYAVMKELLSKNPCDGLKVPKAVGRRFAGSETDGKREAIASPEEAAALIAVIDDPIDQALWATAFYAGLRRGELRGLFPEDIDLEARLITVRRGWDAREGEIAPKSHHGARSVPISAPLLALLADYLGQHDGGQFAFPGYGRRKKDYGPISADALLRRSRKLWKAAGLRPIGLHEARHTYASTMILAGVPIAKVSRYMGHSSIAVTERVYFHLLPNAHDGDLAAIDAFLAGG